MIVTHSPATGASCPDHDGPRLPRGLREEAGSLPAGAFRAKYSPTSGPLRLRNWRCMDDDRPTGQLGPQARRYRATIAVGDRIGTSDAAACGPIAALTAMLYDRGVALEVLSFHQTGDDDGTATFLRGSNGAHDAWAMGWSRDSMQSALRAVVACANRLLESQD